MPLITAREAARRLGVSYPTFKQWIYKGSVRSTRTAGGHHRVSDEEVERLLTASDRPRTGPRRPRPRTNGTIGSLSSRNQLRGIVEEVRVEGLLAQVRLKIGDQMLTAVITRDAIDELKVRRGDEALAIIKATEIMIAKRRTDERPSFPSSTSRARRSSR